jgi:7-cyano-7-deazaguanine synthase
VVLLSGGLDSVVNLALEARLQRPALAITFDYGQRSAGLEAKAATAAASLFEVPHRVVALTWMRRLTQTALVDRRRELPHPSVDELDDVTDAAAKSAAAVWVPNRNGIFLHVAAAFAESLGSRRLVVGFNAEEGATFPDNTPAFAQAVSASLAYSTRNRVEVICHTAELTKAEIVQKGLDLAAPLESVWSCYEEDIEHCGACESCMRARRAYTAAKVPPQLWPVGLRPLSRTVLSRAKGGE